MWWIMVQFDVMISDNWSTDAMSYKFCLLQLDWISCLKTSGVKIKFHGKRGERVPLKDQSFEGINSGYVKF